MVPRKLTDKVRAERLRVSREVRGHFEEEGLGFLQQLVIGDETWVHHYDPENKDSLWITTTKDYQYQRKSKPLVEKSC